MKCGLILFLLIVVPCWSQTGTTGKAETTGTCSPANTGSNNTFTITCGIGKEQGQAILKILNKILTDRLDPEVVMAKLDEILKAVNPNRPGRTFLCDGRWQYVGPGSANVTVITGQDVIPRFSEMVKLLNSREYADLLRTCLAQINSTPEWLTPRLFCGLAYAATGDKVKAQEMLAEFDSKAGPAYQMDQCKQMSDYLRGALQ